jgi:Fis family transcriptional regulator
LGHTSGGISLRVDNNDEQRGFGRAMVARKKAKSRRESAPVFNGRDLKVNGKGVPLRSQAEEALQSYFETLNGHRPAHLYDLVMREVEEPLFKVVMNHVEGNQSRAAIILGINRGTLRKKLKEFGINE